MEDGLPKALRIENESCLWCKHGRRANPKEPYCICGIANTLEKETAARYCEAFEHRMKESDWEPVDGYPVRAYIRERYGTITEWAEKAMVPKDVGSYVEMRRTADSKQTRVYFGPDNVIGFREYGMNAETAFVYTGLPPAEMAKAIREGRLKAAS